MFKRFLLSVYGIILFQTLFSQIPSGYYDSATGTGYTLKTQLYNIIKGHTELSYTPGLWNAYYTTDVDVYYENDGSVLDIYSENPTGTDPYNFELGTDQDDGTNVPEGEHYNREHSFPRNWFGGEVAPMNTDIFHIYPTDKVVNNERSNWPYGEVNSPTWTSANGSKKGPCSYPGYTGTVFEPIDEFKGDLARTYFYMATRYENVIATWPGSDMLDGSNGQCFTSWALNMLLDWHYSDPVSQKEIDRNNEIYDNYQNNRNPFIDHPEYVAKIWGGGGNSLPSISGIVINPATPTSSDAVSVSATITDSDGSITAAELHWGLNSGSLTNTIAMSVSSGNTYITNSNIIAQANGVTVYYEIKATDNESGVNTSAIQSYIVHDGGSSDELLNEDFTTCPSAGWLIYSVAGSENWECGTGYMQVNAFGSDVACDDWLISPAQNLDLYKDEILTFTSWTKYSDSFNPPIELIYSTNYSGSDDPSSANWTELSATWPAQNSQTITNSGNIDISGINGANVYFAFHYISSGTGSGTSTLWEIDNVVITGNLITNESPSISNIQKSPDSPTSEENVTISATITDPDGSISSAVIKWGTSAGSYPNTITMTGAGNNYSGTIGAQAAGATVYFILEATDNESAKTTSTEQSYVVSSTANENPVITNITFSPLNPESTESVSVSATITDSDGSISSAGIKWGTSTGSYPNTIAMAGVSNNYSGIIGAQAAGTTVYFIIEATDNESAKTTSTEQSYVVSSTANENPVITNITFSPSSPESTESVSVSATITDLDGSISTASIKWGTTSGTYSNTVNMSNTGANYSGIIPAQTNGTHVYFIISATDNNGGNSESAEYDYEVFDPTLLPPAISNVSINPANPTADDNVIVSGSVSDEDGTIETVILKWKVAGGTFTDVNMNLSGDKYYGQIPKQTAGTTINYTVVATDNDSQQATQDGVYTVSQTNGINDITNQKLNLYPNPVKNILNISIQDYSGSIDIKIYDILGKMVYKEKLQIANKNSIKLDGLDSGIYFINFEIDNKLITKQIIVDK